VPGRRRKLLQADPGSGLGSRWKSSLREKLERSRAGRFLVGLRVVWGDRAMARRQPRDAWRYVLHSRELTNFSYELENEDEIASFVASALGVEPGETERYLAELRADRGLVGELRTRLAGSTIADHEPRLGKRRAIYCAVRVARPKVVVESGVKDGLGSLVLMRALERNESEGFPGKLIAFDIDPAAGWLVDSERNAGRFEYHLGDVRETLEPVLATHGVDFFINDSLHELEHETFEYEAAIRHRKSGPLVLYCDDAGVTPALAETCRRHGGNYRTLQEVPRDHYWRGNLIGLCVLGEVQHGV
jgi:predicted O-methyltransferase YrrM